MIVGALFLVALNAFFVAAEFGLVAARRARIDQLVVEGSARAAAAQRAMRELNLLLSGCQLGITFASLGLGWIGEPAFVGLLRGLFEPLPGPLDVIATPERVALWVAIPIRGFTRLFQPLIWLFNEGANRVVRLLGVEPQSELRSVHTLEEIRLLLEESRRAGAIELPHANIFERTFEFPDKRVHDATVPRSDVHAVATDHDVSEVLDLARRSGHSRFPVHDEKSSEYIGVVHLADMLRADHQDPGARVKDGMREPLVVPESLRLDVLLRQMNEARTHFAIVVDEYGSTSGIITLDDVLAELVGEIADEHRDPSETVRRLENGTYRVAGQIRIEELHRATGCSLPEGDYETLGGFISQRLGRIARSGDTIDYDGWRMRVVSVQRRRILTVDVDPPRVHANRA